MSRAQDRKPDLVAEVEMLSSEQGGRRSAAMPGWGCPCFVSLEPPLKGWDAVPLMEGRALEPGEQRTMGFVFLSGETAAAAIKAAGRFYLWEGRVIGMAKVVA